MTVVTWSSSVNTKFYSVVPKPIGNTTKTSFISGRNISFQNNTKILKQITCKLEVTSTELDAFWTWYNDTLGQDTNAFTCTALGNNYYKIVEVPEPEESMTSKTVLNLVIEEVL